MIRFVAFFFIAMLTTSVCFPSIHAADIQVVVSSEEAYVGYPITLQVQIDNASKLQQPEIDDVDGLTIQSMGNEPRNQPMIGSNGRITVTNSTVYKWTVTPTRDGKFTIPPIRIRADGIASITKAVRITAIKSDAGDMLIAEVESNQDSVFVGEPIELTLKIYVKAFIDEDANIELSDGSMWSLLSDQTQWGVFGKTMNQLTMNRMEPRGNEVIREDADGKDATYYRYDVDATLYPSRRGQVDMKEVKIKYDYPLEISSPSQNRRGRSTFESMLGDSFFFGGSRSSRRVTKWMPMIVEPELASVVAKPIPTKGQPKEFAGAVGRYVVETFASDKTVQAGDPVQLTIRIRGTGQMDTIAAPPLPLIDALADNFKVSSQPLAGQVDRDQKVFITTIRPKDQSVTEIPAIPFTYFDPASGEYETSYSQPIPISVSPAEILELDRAVRVDADAPGPAKFEPKTTSAEFKPNLDLAWRDVTQNKDQTKVSLVNVIIPAVLLPPFIFLTGLLMRGFVVINRRSASESKTLHKIKSADQASEMATAMNHYSARRWKVPSHESGEADPSSDRILGHLRSVGLHRYAIRLEQWMDRVTQNQSISDTELESIRQSAMDIVKDAKSQRTIPSRTSVATLIAVGFLTIPCGSAFAEESLPTESQTLIQRAESSYREGDFPGSANLMNSVEPENQTRPELFVNLGNAWWQSGDKARSKASYLRALQVDPTDDIARQNLMAAENPNWLMQKIVAPSMRMTLLVSIVGWTIFWATLALRLWTDKFPWRSMTSLCLLVTLIAGCIAALQLSNVWYPHHAVIVADEVNLHSGDGDSFDIVQTIADASGKVILWKVQRPGWIQVVTSDGSEGWVPEEAVVVVSG